MHAEEVAGAVNAAQLILLEEQLASGVGEQADGDLVEDSVGGEVDTLGAGECGLEGLPEGVVGGTGVDWGRGSGVGRSCGGLGLDGDAAGFGDDGAEVGKGRGFELLCVAENNEGGILRFGCDDESDVDEVGEEGVAVVDLELRDFDGSFARLEGFLHVVPGSDGEGFLLRKGRRDVGQGFFGLIDHVAELLDLGAVAGERGERGELRFS